MGDIVPPLLFLGGGEGGTEFIDGSSLIVLCLGLGDTLGEVLSTLCGDKGGLWSSWFSIVAVSFTCWGVVGN